jgi:hypothetical protein
MLDCIDMKSQLNLDILHEWLKVGTMFLVSRLLETQQNNTPFADQKWIESSIFTLLGFTTYHIVTKRFVQIDNANPIIQNVINTVLKIGTMLVVSRLLSRQSITDEKWIRSSLYTLVGFSAYDAFTHKLVPSELEGDYRVAANDAMNFGTMFVVSRLLEGGSLSDEKWIKSSLYTIAGFVAYDLIGKNLYSKVLSNYITMDDAQMEEDAHVQYEEEADEHAQMEADAHAQYEEEADAHAQMEADAHAQMEADAHAQMEADAQMEAEPKQENIEGFGVTSNDDSYASFNY